MAKKLPVQTLNISLLREGATAEDALRVSDYDEYEISALSGNGGRLAVRGSPDRAPRWTKLLLSEVPDLRRLISRSSGAVLFLEAAARLFVVRFGQGRHMLDDEQLISDFGLKVVLNAVDQRSLRSVDTKTIDEATTNVRRDTSTEAGIGDFGLDVSRDLLRAVTGRPSDGALGESMTGAGPSLSVKARITLEGLPALCTSLLEQSTATAYRERFGFVDNVQREKSVVIRDRLDRKLTELLRLRALDDIHIASPEVLDWSEIHGFSFRPGDEDLDADPRISRYLEERPDAIQPEQLRRQRLYAHRGDSDTPRSWPLYKCLVGQIEDDGQMFVLSGGEWFRVAQTYRETIETEATAVSARSDLPPAGAGTSERVYNQKLASAIDGVLLDGKLVQDGGPDSIEVCDVLTRDGAFLHVKHRGASSTLSHLFAQAVNSAERIALEAAFRAAVRELTREADSSFEGVVPSERPTRGALEVALVVITRSQRDTPLTLPFFSVISLVGAVRRLERLGFRVTATAVREEA